MIVRSYAQTTVMVYITIIMIYYKHTTQRSSKEIAPPVLAVFSLKRREPPTSILVCRRVTPPPWFFLKVFIPMNFMGYLKLNTAPCLSALFPRNILPKYNIIYCYSELTINIHLPINELSSSYRLINTKIGNQVDSCTSCWVVVDKGTVHKGNCVIYQFWNVWL